MLIAVPATIWFARKRITNSPYKAARSTPAPMPPAEPSQGEWVT